VRPESTDPAIEAPTFKNFFKKIKKKKMKKEKL